jgi:hypothetical protein
MDATPKREGERVAWFCSTCLAQVVAAIDCCPRCGADPAVPRTGRDDFERALVRALDHPLHDRRLVAARVLGLRRAVGAVPDLIRAVEAGTDPYLAAEAVLALARIGDPAGLAAIRRAAENAPVIARAAAREILARLPGTDQDTS